MFTMPSTNSGTSAVSAANSSTQMSRLGGAWSGWSRSSATRSLAPYPASSSSRAEISAYREVSARATSAGLRSVMYPTVCGRSAHSRKAAPPL